ncbi:hypothetical protein E2C01_062664 [Portunus trituberculatus]|uniref:Uncharacterized protein n=1 Tax=Portunus trituberculatus TaxID=210409 RepID=A0A5B7HBQ8_PORTR|nr:hypothetical protein [Portunus trituberculatus]
MLFVLHRKGKTIANQLLPRDAAGSDQARTGCLASAELTRQLCETWDGSPSSVLSCRTGVASVDTLALVVFIVLSWRPLTHQLTTTPCLVEAREAARGERQQAGGNYSGSRGALKRVESASLRERSLKWRSVPFLLTGRGMWRLLAGKD